MTEQFILPNWHVILIHYPLGLLTAGVVMEFLGLVRRRTTLRSVARWFILLGALLAIPTVMAGIYAFRDVVAPGNAPVEGPWYQAVRDSRWNAEQWEMMTDHLWMTCAATGLFLLAAIAWLASSESLRRSRAWYGLTWLLLLAGLALVSAGAWNSGEAVYRYGTAVRAAQPPASAAPAPAQSEGHEHDDAAPEQEEPAHPVWEQTLDYFVPPLQLHLILAGLAVAFGAAALGLSIKRWEEPGPTPEQLRQRLGEQPAPAAPAEPAVETGPYPVTPGDIAGSFRSPGPSPAGAPSPSVVLVPVRVFPARHWIFTSLIAILAAAVGIWSVGGLSWTEAQGALRLVTEPDHRRLLWHVGSGVLIIALPLVLGLIVRLTRGARFFTSLLMLVFVAAVAWQVWSGVLMVYDSHEGPLTGFNAPSPTTLPATSP